MRAVVIEDGGLIVAERPDPTQARGELLVRVHAAGLNAADLLQRAGFYPAPPGSPPDIPGLELAGVVEAVGDDVQHFAPGDAVMAVVGGGGQAELATVHERTALAVPEGLPLLAAGGFAEAFTTAHDALFTQCGLSSGERVLVNGAAGGVGLAGVQLAVATGARVVASVRRAELHDAVAAFGALAVDPAEAGRHGPFDVVLELVGGPNLEADIQSLATGGRIVVIGVGAGARAEIDLHALMTRRARIHASTLRSRPLEQKAAAAQLVERHVLPLLAAGLLTVPVDSSFGLEEVEAAYDRFAGGGKLGKVVIDLTPLNAPAQARPTEEER